MADVFTLKVGDTAPSLLVECTGDAGPLDLTAASSVTFVMAPADGSGTAIRRPAVIADAVAGLVRYDWLPGDTDTEGLYAAEVEIAWSAGTLQTVPGHGSLRIRVEPSIG